jgi:tetratricopeptide (TPR) repeat protein
MPPSHEEAVKLFRNGEFAALIAAFSRNSANYRELNPPERALVAYALTMTGRLQQAEQLALMDCDSSDPRIRSTAESALAASKWRQGDLGAAMRHSQAALHFANESADAERIGWASLAVFRLLIEGGTVDKVLAALPDVRRAVNRAGVGQAAAYLHSCVAVLEGQTGRLDEAWRHCEIAESLLRVSPNAWLTSSILLNRGCMCILRCDFTNALRLLNSAKQIARQSGYLYTAVSADSNIGHIEFFIGEFDKAKATFRELLRDPTVSLLSKVGAASGLARVHLALGELAECDETLQFIALQAERDDRIKSLYHVRWAAITKALLLLKQRNPTGAAEWIDNAMRDYATLGDGPLKAAIHLVGAQLAATTGDRDQAASHILFSSELECASIRELQAQYYHSCGVAAAGDNPQFSDDLRHRAARLWSHQGIVSVPRELNADVKPNADESMIRVTSCGVEAIASALASFTDLSNSPRLLAAEMLSVIKALKSRTAE